MSNDDLPWHNFKSSLTPLGPTKKKVKRPPRTQPSQEKLQKKKERQAVPGPVQKNPNALVTRIIKNGSLDREWSTKFKQDKISVEARLDLHGLTRNSAYSRLTEFIQTSRARQYRYLLIITGKGSQTGTDTPQPPGVLRASLPLWLENISEEIPILWYGRACAKHGGDGATYVILKRARGVRA